MTDYDITDADPPLWESVLTLLAFLALMPLLLATWLSEGEP